MLASSVLPAPLAIPQTITEKITPPTIPNRIGIIFQIPFKKTMEIKIITKVTTAMDINAHKVPMLSFVIGPKLAGFKYESRAAFPIIPQPIIIIAGPTIIGDSNFFILDAFLVK